jgi:hypothetical protein
MKKGKEVELYLPITSDTIYMSSIAGQKRRNMIGPYHLSLR